MPSTHTGFDFLIETLKSKPEASETVSFRISGIDVETWNNLKQDHPDTSATELLKEGLRVRHLADAADRAGSGLFFRQGTGEYINVLELLGLSRARKVNAEDAHSKVPAKALAATSRPPQKTSKKQTSSGSGGRRSASTSTSEKRPHDTVP